MSSELKLILKRVIARFTDYCLLYFFVLIPFFGRFFLYTDWLHLLIAAVGVPLLWAPIEALLLSTFGNTPGKVLQGLKIKNQSGYKLSLSKALKRSFWFLTRGVFLNIPPLNVISLYLEYRKDKTAFSWDRGTNTFVERKEPKKRKRFLFSVICNLLIACGLSFAFYISYECKNIIVSTQEKIFSKNFSSAEIVKEFNWFSYKDPKGKYKIEFPEKPKNEQVEFPIPNSEDTLPFEEVKHSKKHLDFSLSHTELPRSWTKWGSSLVLKGALKFICKYGNEGKLLKKNLTKFKKHTAIDYLLKKSNTHETAGRLILVSNVLYKIEITYPIDQKESVQNLMMNFFDSFDPK